LIVSKPDANHFRSFFVSGNLGWLIEFAFHGEIERLKLSDPARELRGWQPERDGRDRCSVWSGSMNFQMGRQITPLVVRKTPLTRHQDEFTRAKYNAKALQEVGWQVLSTDHG